MDNESIRKLIRAATYSNENADRPKIGQWVFQLPCCPEAASAAVLNADGLLVFYQGNPSDVYPDGDRYWGARRGSWHQHRDRDSASLWVYCDATDWQHSLTIRDRLNPQTRTVVQVGA